MATKRKRKGQPVRFVAELSQAAAAASAPLVRSSSLQNIADQVDGLVNSMSRFHMGSPGVPRTERRERKGLRSPYTMPQYISVADEIFADLEKQACGICQRALRIKTYDPQDNTASYNEEVVAVLSCGHVFHGDCLDQRTRPDDKADPPCPPCEAQRPPVNSSVEQD